VKAAVEGPRMAPDRSGPRGVPAGPLEAPGKREIVPRGVALADLRPNARLLDVGCGLGTSVDALRRSLGLRAIGLDLAAPAGVAPPIPRLRADARLLPIAEGALDAVLLECVLSIVLGREAVLRECARALAPGGKLVVSDLYARQRRDGSPVGLGPCGAELLSREAMLRLVAASGFDVLHWEDRSRVLKEYLFQHIMQADREWPRIGCPVPADQGAARPDGSRPGYFLLVAGRRRA